MKYYKSYRIIEGKPRWVIVDETGRIVNRNPSKDELKGLEREIYGYKRCYVGYTNNELLNYLKQFYEENGRVPVAIDFDGNSRYPSFNTYRKYFGSWNKALERTELLNKRKRQLYTNEELLNYLKQFYEENGRSPKIDDFTHNYNYPGSVIYWTRFGSWNKALELAGLYTNSKQCTDEELLDYLIIFYKENGRVPALVDFLNNPKYPHCNT